jgi:hypothetical protein
MQRHDIEHPGENNTVSNSGRKQLQQTLANYLGTKLDLWRKQIIEVAKEKAGKRSTQQ